MHRIVRTAPVVSMRPRSPVATVHAVVVAVLAAVLGLATPPPGAPATGPSAHVTSADHIRHDGTRTAADHLRYDGACADDGCDAARVVRAAGRHEQPHGERPAPRGPSGICERSAHVTPCLLPNRHAPANRCVPASQPHGAQDQGRAPPAFSGT
ncbi:hypothetical protein [Streptomyces tibetensis]|uniref:hypothetical protein n=1 Tax=Streptomyces tibetensis TaxID=2382123 RepID=UPI0033FDC6D1